MNDSIQIIKLSSGQELIAKIVERADGVTVVSHPMTVQPVREGNQMKISLMPFLWGAASGEAMPINDYHVVCMTKANPDLRNEFAGAIGDVVIATPRITLAE